MSSKTKIVVLRMKEIIYTAIFVGLGILLITLFLVMFRPKKDSVPTASDVTYLPGVYTSSITLNNQDVNVEVTVDADKITSVALVPLSEAVTTMYPLMQPSMDSLSEQIVKNQSTKNLSYSDETRYTSTVLLNAVNKALSKAQLENKDT